MHFTNQMSKIYNLMVRKITDEHPNGHSAVTAYSVNFFHEANLPRKMGRRSLRGTPITNIWMNNFDDFFRCCSNWWWWWWLIQRSKKQTDWSLKVNSEKFGELYWRHFCTGGHFPTFFLDPLLLVVWSHKFRLYMLHAKVKVTKTEVNTCETP